MLDFRIYTFLTVCETMNFTHACEKLHITQPAVSQHIKALEQMYNTKLFYQHGKKMVLSESGKLLLNAMNTINNDITHLKNEIANINHNKIIKFGATLTIGEYIMPNILIKNLKVNNSIQISMIVDNTKRLLTKLNKGEIDFALVEGFFPSLEYDSLVYKSEEFLPVCSTKYNTDNIRTIKDLLNENLFIREQGSGTRDVLEKTLQEHNILISDFKNIKEIGNLNVIKKFILENLGISFLYKSVVENELLENKMKIIPIKDFKLSHEFSFIWQKNSIYSDYYKHIFELLH